MNIPIYCSETKTIDYEKILDESIIKFFYQSVLGKLFVYIIAKRLWFSRLYSLTKKATFSTRDITKFIENFNVDISEFKEKEYSDFNDFFIREFRPGKRIFETDPSLLPAFAEARYCGWESTSHLPELKIKNNHYTIEDLLQKKDWIEIFEGGPMLIARLAPQDYHRFNYADCGEIIDKFNIKGNLHSVNPIATQRYQNIFSLNQRFVTIQETKNFGKLAYVDIGAMTIGSIIHHHSKGHRPNRGDERGYFQFGGSTIILIGEPGKWIVSKEINLYTLKGIEVYVKLGKTIGKGGQANV